MRTAARFLSVVLHPVFMPTYIVWAMLTVDPGLAYFIHPDRRMIPLFMLALMSAAFPLASIQLLVRARVIDSLELHRREDRFLPYGITFIYYVISWYLMFRTPLHPAVPAVMAGASAALLFTLIITLQWKISAHMVGIGGMLGALAAINSLHALDLFLLVASIIVLAGMLGTARLLSSDHTQGQVIAGAVLGAGVTYASVTMLV